MKMKTRFLPLALAALFVFSLTTGLIWNGCSNENAKVNSPADITLMSTDKLAPVMAIQDKHTDELLQVNGVVGTGTGVDANGKLVVKVFTSRAGVANIPASLEGVPVEVEETGDFQAMALSGRYRPVPIGVSVGNNNECAAGTIGCVVYKGNTKYFLSNNHVLARENHAAIGENLVQPGRYENAGCADHVSTDKIGTLSDYQTINFSGGNNTIDAAIGICGLSRARHFPLHSGHSSAKTVFTRPSFWLGTFNIVPFSLQRSPAFVVQPARGRLAFFTCPCTRHADPHM